MSIVYDICYAFNRQVETLTCWPFILHRSCGVPLCQSYSPSPSSRMLFNSLSSLWKMTTLFMTVRSCFHVPTTTYSKLSASPSAPSKHWELKQIYSCIWRVTDLVYCVSKRFRVMVSLLSRLRYTFMQSAPKLLTQVNICIHINIYAVIYA